jgi:DNA-directed RNA polymerase subunit K/omega
MTTDVDAPATNEEPPVVKAAPIHSRFLFVDIAAQRAKQLRRGATARVPLPLGGHIKLERVAMTEVKEGLVEYSLPVFRAPGEATA